MERKVRQLYGWNDVHFKLQIYFSYSALQCTMFRYASLILKLTSACSLTFSCNYMPLIDLGVNEDFANQMGFTAAMFGKPLCTQ
jgi:hypothetical protein